MKTNHYITSTRRPRLLILFELIEQKLFTELRNFVDNVDLRDHLLYH